MDKPNDIMKHKSFRRQIDKSTTLHEVLMHYDMVSDQNEETSDYDILRKAIDKLLAQKKQQKQRLELARRLSASSAPQLTSATHLQPSHAEPGGTKATAHKKDTCPHEHPPGKTGSKKKKGKGRRKGNRISQKGLP